MRKIMGGIIIVMALAMIVVPIFTDCQSQGRSLELANGKTVPMKCHWTGIASMALAIPLGVVGISQIVTKRRETANVLSVLGVTMGTLAILLPTVLIGVCATPTMLCNMIMKPALIAAGAIAIAASAVYFTSTRKEVEIAA